MTPGSGFALLHVAGGDCERLLAILRARGLPLEHRPSGHYAIAQGSGAGVAELADGLLCWNCELPLAREPAALAALIDTDPTRLQSLQPGPFTLLRVAGGRCVAFRDRLGGRALYRRLLRCGCTVWSSWLWPMVDNALFDDQALIHHYGACDASGELTWFSGIRQLPPAAVQVVDEHGEHSLAVQGFSRELDPRDCAELAGALASAVRQSLQARIADVDRPALLLSGGIDSTLLALGLVQLGRADDVLSISYWPRTVPAADESAYAQLVARALGLRWLAVDVSAGDLPVDPLAWPLTLETPLLSPFQTLTDMALQQAAALGAEVVLSGGGGDFLYPIEAHWLVDGLASGHWRASAVELTRRLLRAPLAAHRDPGLRRAIACLIGWRTRPAHRYQWLTEAARTRLQAAPPAADRSPQFALATGSRAAASSSALPAFCAMHGIELRQPYRDPALVQFGLSLPALWAWRGGIGKALTRELAVDLPEAVRWRAHKHSLISIYRRWMANPARAAACKALLADEDALWRGWVEPSFIAAGAPGNRADQRDEGLLWQILATEAWGRRVRAALAARPRAAAAPLAMETD